MKKTTRIALWATIATLGIGSLASVNAADESTRNPNRNRDYSAKTNDHSQGRNRHPDKFNKGDNSLGHLERADKLIGKEVIGSDNQKLGKIDDLVADLASGRILYAIVGSGGVLGAGEKRYAVPPGAFSSIDNKSAMINADKAKLTSAPEFTKDMDKNEELAKNEFTSKSFEYFGQQAWWQSGSTAASSGQLPTVRKVSELLDQKVKNVNDEDIAKSEDMMINLPAGRIAFVILEPDSKLDLGKNYYALPPDALSLNKDGKSLTSDLTKEKLASAPHVPKGEWTKLSDPSFASQVYQYYGKQAWFETTGELKPTGRTDKDDKN